MDILFRCVVFAFAVSSVNISQVVRGSSGRRIMYADIGWSGGEAREGEEEPPM